MPNDSLPDRANAALIVGGGLSGMQSALLLAETGHRVYLLDTAPGIGGSLHLLDRTFPTDSCGLCISSPTNATYCPSLECAFHPNITPMALTELLAVDGEPGRFKANVRHNPRYVNVELCNLCGDCADVCPATRPHPYEGDLAPQKAIYAPPARSVPNAYVIDMDACIRCGKCVEACPTGAINLDEQPAEETLEVGAIILSPGYEPFDARKKGEFGFGILDNVLTSLQFERMTSAPGSTRGHLVRPSDGRPPKRIAFIQCVGSRDETIQREYCSSVCCMYTAKQARAAVEMEPGVDVTVFTMDVRTFGKGYERYFDSVEQTDGIRYRRAMVSSIKQHPRTRDLSLTYTTEEGRPVEEDFDLAVLAVGFDSPEPARNLAESLGIHLNQYGFAETDSPSGVSSSRPGIIAAGCYQEPKDIPDTVAEAAAAAAEAMRYLAPAPIAPPDTPAEAQPAKDEEPRVGIYLCSCEGTLEGTLDMAALAAYAESLPHAAAVKIVANACTGNGDLTAWVEETKVNRLVVAGCSHRLVQPSVEASLRDTTLDPGRVLYANLREGCAWVHRDAPSAANAKARDLLAMAVARAPYGNGTITSVSEVTDTILVIGGGLAGMNAALAAASMGHPVALVEREETLGGQLFNIGAATGIPDPAALGGMLVEQVDNHPSITVYRGARVESLSGAGGNFRCTLQRIGADSVELPVGAVIVATGGQEARIAEYLYGEDPRVVLQGDVSRAFVPDDDTPTGKALAAAQSVVMIQCAGSRDDRRPYCSRICCTQAVENAIRIKERQPEADVFILYRDIRTYGFRESLYRKARDLGVVFVRYEADNKPQVGASADGLTVTVEEAVLRQPVQIRADLVVLSTGLVPNDNQTLADALGVPLDADGFFQEQHPKMRPMNFMKPGVFLCGLAHSPRFVPETVAQARGAAMRAVAYLAQRPRLSKPTRVQVNKRLCSFCGLCVTACPYGARVMDYEERVAQVLPELCQGCGLCAMVCPNKATQQIGFEHKALLAEVDAAILGL